MFGGLTAAGTPSALAAARVHSADNGQIDGQLVDGTTNGAPITNQKVALVVQIGAAQHQVTTTATDAQGNFHFTGLPTDQSDVYAATTTYQGATYSTDPLSLAGDPHPSPITLLAYDATSSDAKIGVAEVTIYINKPSAAQAREGVINVAELVTMVNADQRAYVGTPGPSNGKPMNLLRFALPAGAKDLVVQGGFSPGAQVMQVDRGFATTSAVPPGETQFSFAYSYPYTSTQAALSYHSVYPTARVLILAPPDVTVSAQGLTSMGKTGANGKQVQAWVGGNLLPGKAVSVSLAHLPAPGEQPSFSLIWLYVLAGLLAALAFGVVGYYVRRGPGASAAVDAAAKAAKGRSTTKAGGKAGSKPTAKKAEGMDDVASAHEGEAAMPQALLQALARLEREHTAGTLDDLSYRVQRNALKAELKAQMLAATSVAATGEQQ